MEQGEHRLFCHITANWRGTPLTTYETIVDRIGNVRTATGLRVRAELDAGEYPTGVTVTKEQMDALALVPDAFHANCYPDEVDNFVSITVLSMTKSQKIQLRQSEIRQRLNDLLGNDARSEDEQAELEKLTGEAQTLETEFRAALVAEPDPEVTVTDPTDPETRERLALLQQGHARRLPAGGAAGP